MIKKRKPTTPSSRFTSFTDFSDITVKKPLKSLTKPIRKKGGRNNLGRVTAFHRGGGAKKKYRIIDIKRDKYGIEAKVFSIEYDPMRSARIARLVYRDGEKRYIICPQGLSVGDRVVSGPGAPLKPGNALPLSEIPPGTEVHNIELQPGVGGKLVRSAGTWAIIVSKEGGYAYIKLTSGEVRLIPLKCFATIGRVSNPDHRAVSLGKAGRKRLLGRRPHVRGSCMNPVDHPMGGGEGKSKGHIPRSRSGVLAKGYRTRKKKLSDKYIVRRRK
jgi:large subunit ribosomal protein L2